MSAQLVNIRDQVVKALQAFQTSPGYAFNTFAIAKTNIPVSKIEDPALQGGKCWCIAVLGDDKDRKTRPGINPLISRELMVQVAYQQSNISPDDATNINNSQPTVDTLLWVTEQLRDAVKNFPYDVISADGVQPLWVRNEVLKDENGVPYHYYMLREAVTFEAYFTACFTIPHQ